MTINVRDYGAIGDGIADDAPAFLAAFAVNTTVYAPAGTYLLGSQILSGSPSRKLYGDGVHATMLKRKGSLAGGIQMLDFEGDGVLQDLTVDGNWSAIAIGTGDDVRFIGPNCLAQRVRFQNSGHIAVADVGIGNRYIQCQFVGAGVTGNGKDTDGAMYGLWSGHSASRAMGLIGCEFRDFRFGGAFIGGTQATLTACLFRNNHISTVPGGGGQLAFPSDSSFAGHVVQGCVFQAPGGVEAYAIEIDAEDVTIIGCNIDMGGVGTIGINLQATTGTLISGCTVKNATRSGIEVQAGVSGNRIIGNRCYDNQGSLTQQWGIRVVAGATDNDIIALNDLRGNINVDGIQDLGTGSNRQMLANLPAPILNHMASSSITLAGGKIYVESGKLKYKSPAGHITILAPA